MAAGAMVNLGFGFLQPGVELSHVQAGQRVAQPWPYGGKRRQHERAVAPGGVRDDERPAAPCPA